VKATINGKTYDTEEAKQQAEFLTYSDGDHKLYRTEAGEFFLVLSDCVLDGRRLGPLESLPPELHVSDGGRESRQLRDLERRRRLCWEERLLPVTELEAMTWCIKTQIPETFRGYLLECLPAPIGA